MKGYQERPEQKAARIYRLENQTGDAQADSLTAVRSVIILIILLSLIFMMLGLLRWHLRRRRQRGMTTWLWGLLPLIPRTISPTAARDVYEQAALQAIDSITCTEWEDEADAENPDLVCSLCLEPFQHGEMIARLACFHRFHKKCVVRWLREAQKYKKRRCPLCNLDPFLPPAQAQSQAREPASAHAPSAVEEVELPSA
jgi:hypothetical protein